MLSYGDSIYFVYLPAFRQPIQLGFLMAIQANLLITKTMENVTYKDKKAKSLHVSLANRRNKLDHQRKYFICLKLYLVATSTKQHQKEIFEYSYFFMKNDQCWLNRTLRLLFNP